MPPLVSVILPVFNGEKYLAQAIHSILGQSYRPLEILAVDDASNDRSLEILSSFPEIRVLRQQHLGVAKARNLGISQSHGSFIAFLDQDDLWVSEKIKTQVAYLLKHPEVGFVFSKEYLFLEPGCPVPSWCKPELINTEHNTYVLGALLARRSAFETVGSFDPSYEMGNDTDWILRAKDAGVSYAMLPQVLLRKRLHERNESARLDLYRSDTLALLRASLKRRRELQT